MFGWLKKKMASSPSMVMTGPGVLKTHNVECRFWSEPGQRGAYHGKLSQDRWSDGQERFSLRLAKLPEHDGKVTLLRGDQAIADFEAKGSSAHFAWKGTSTEEIPQFAIGEELAIAVGASRLTGIVEPD